MLQEKNVLSNKNEVLDSTFYQLADTTYKSDKDIEEEVVITNKEGRSLQAQEKGGTFHDKLGQTQQSLYEM